MLKKRVKIRKVVSALREGKLFTHAVKDAGMSRMTWLRWEKAKPRLENLRRAAEEACEQHRNHAVEDAFYKTLLTGKAHPISYIFFMTNRQPERWKDKRAVASGTFVNKVDVNNAGRAEDESIRAKEAALLNRLSEHFGI